MFGLKGSGRRCWGSRIGPFEVYLDGAVQGDGVKGRRKFGQTFAGFHVRKMGAVALIDAKGLVAGFLPTAKGTRKRMLKAVFGVE